MASSLVALDARGHPRQLLFGRVGLTRLPLRIRNAIDRLARRVAVERTARRFLDPFGETIAAEAGMPHQVDILDVLALAEMVDQPAEGCRRGRIVDLLRHLILLPLSAVAMAD